MSSKELTNEPMYRVAEVIPCVSDYGRLRAGVGWNEIVPDAASKGLDSSLYSVCVYDGDDIIGHGRVVGDGGVYFYIQDVMVLPQYQGKGIGHQIMSHIMTYIAHHAHPGSFVALMAAKGTELFYNRYGFTRRPSDCPGMFLVVTA